MAREKWLIDANEAIANTYEEVYCTESEQAWIRNFIIRQPTVDAVEVVHGEWSTIEDDYIGMLALQCSKCNQEYWFENEPPLKIYNYCPNCGAKMDGDGNG